MRLFRAQEGPYGPVVVFFSERDRRDWIDRGDDRRIVYYRRVPGAAVPGPFSTPERKETE